MHTNTTNIPITDPSSPRLPVTNTTNINAKYNRETKNDLEANDILPDLSTSSNTSIFHTVVAYQMLNKVAVKLTIKFSWFILLIILISLLTLILISI